MNWGAVDRPVFANCFALDFRHVNVENFRRHFEDHRRQHSSSLNRFKASMQTGMNSAPSIVTQTRCFGAGTGQVSIGRESVAMTCHDRLLFDLLENIS